VAAASVYQVGMEIEMADEEEHVHTLTVSFRGDTRTKMEIDMCEHITGPDALGMLAFAVLAISLRANREPVDIARRLTQLVKDMQDHAHGTVQEPGSVH